MTTTLTHAAGCPSDRIDITDHPERGVTAFHCVDCSAHEVRTAAGEIVPPPETTGPYADQQQGAAWDAMLEPAGASQPDHVGKTEWDQIERNRI